MWTMYSHRNAVLLNDNIVLFCISTECFTGICILAPTNSSTKFPSNRNAFISAKRLFFVLVLLSYGKGQRDVTLKHKCTGMYSCEIWIDYGTNIIHCHIVNSSWRNWWWKGYIIHNKLVYGEFLKSLFKKKQIAHINRRTSTTTVDPSTSTAVPSTTTVLCFMNLSQGRASARKYLSEESVLKLNDNFMPEKSLFKVIGLFEV